MYSPGWYHAQGDPAGTVRYWDGAQWLGQAIAPERRQTSGGYDLIPPQEAASSQGHEIGAMNVIVAERRPTGTRPAAQAKTFRNSRSDRLISSGAVLLVLGLFLGIAGQNIVTLFTTPTEVSGTVTESRLAQGRRGRVTLRVEVTTAVGQFYVSGRPTSIRSDIRNVTVLYSEHTGGLVAIPEFGRDRRTTGRFIWPAVAVIATFLGFVRLSYERRAFRDGLIWAFALIFLVVGPLASLPVGEALEAMLTTMYEAP